MPPDGRKSRKPPAPAQGRRGEPVPPGHPRGLVGRIGTVAEHPLVPPVIVLMLTVLLYARTIGFPLYNSDDNLYLLDDPRVQELSVDNLQRIWTRTFLANYHPFTTMTYAADHAVWGRWLPGYHLTHLAWYVCGVALVYCLSVKLLGNRCAAAAAAAIYAAHASHVEVVAWLAQRKDLLCLVFYTAATLAYARYAADRPKRWRTYAAAVLLGVTAMLSKGTAVVLPAILVAYDLCYAKAFCRRQVLDKLPFVASAFMITVVTFLAQGKDGALESGAELAIGPGLRFGVNANVFAAYVGRALLPVKLSLEYPIGPAWPSVAAGVLGGLLALVIVVAFLLLRRRLPEAAFGLALFVLPLTTVMNVFWTLKTWINDRYLFLPTVGSSLILVSATLWLLDRPRLPEALRRTVPACVLGIIVAYSWLTICRVGVWRDEPHLRSDTFRKQMRLGGSGLVTADELRRVLKGEVRLFRKPLDNLINAYARAGMSTEARALGSVFSGLVERDDDDAQMAVARREMGRGEYDKAVSRLLPIAEGNGWWSPEAWIAIGTAHEQTGRADEANDAYTKAVEGCRKNGVSAKEALIRLGKLELNAGHLSEARAFFHRVRSKGGANDSRATLGLAVVLEKTGELEEAQRLCREILAHGESVPAGVAFSMAEAHLQAGIVAKKLKQPVETITHFEETLRLAPTHRRRAWLHTQIALASEGLRDYKKALEHYEGTLVAAPDHPERAKLLLKIGQAAEKLGDPGKAVASYEGALRTAPDYPDRAAVSARIDMLRQRADSAGPTQQRALGNPAGNTPKP